MHPGLYLYIFNAYNLFEMSVVNPENEQKITKAEAASLVARLATEEPTFLLQSSHAEKNLNEIEPHLNLLLLLLGFNNQALTQVNRYAVGTLYQEESGEITRYEFLVTIPATVVIDALASALEFIQSQAEGETHEVVTHVYFLLSYLFRSSTEQLLNELSPVSVKQTLIAKYLQLPDDDPQKEVGLQKHLPELIERLNKIKLLLKAMTALKNSQPVVTWLDEVNATNGSLEARKIMQEFYDSFVEKMQEAALRLSKS